MKMVNNLGRPHEINRWLTELANDRTKDIQSVSLVNDADSVNGGYILAVVLYKDGNLIK